LKTMKPIKPNMQ